MNRGRIAVIMPAIYDSLDKEFLNGVYSAAQSIGLDTLVSLTEKIPPKTVKHTLMFLQSFAER